MNHVALVSYNSTYKNPFNTPVMFLPPQYTPKVYHNEVFVLPAINQVTLPIISQNPHVQSQDQAPLVAEQRNSILTDPNNNSNNQQSVKRVERKQIPPVQLQSSTFAIRNGKLEEISSIESRWTREEDQKLLKACKDWYRTNHQFFDFDQIKNSIPGKTAQQCSDRFKLISYRDKSINWTPAQLTKLEHGIAVYGLQNWKEVAKIVGDNKTIRDCFNKWRSLTPAQKKSMMQRIEKERNFDQNLQFAIENLAVYENPNNPKDAVEDDVFDFNDLGDLA